MPNQNQLDIQEVARELLRLKREMVQLGVPKNTVLAVETRALRTGRRMTGAHRSNRASRWRMKLDDPQYGTEIDCKLICIKLLSQLLEFTGAPAPPVTAVELSRKYFDHQLATGTYRDPFTREKLSYEDFLAESSAPRHGLSDFHIGHENPKSQPKHTPLNVNWRTARSNLLQGNMTLYEARAKFVELIARYFNLGEVRIEPDEA